jgi:ribonucleoside-diphosphate reductase alpha chain
MGLALLEGDHKNERAIEFYDLLVHVCFTSATPTLFNSGTLHPQLSSCYLSTGRMIWIASSKSFRQCPVVEMGRRLGNDWTNIRALTPISKG